MHYNLFIPQMNISRNDWKLTLSDSIYLYDYDNALTKLKNNYKYAIDCNYCIEQARILEIYGGKSMIENQIDFLKYKDADLSDLPYKERKEICDRFISITYHIFDTNLNKVDEICTLYDESNISRFNLSEDMEIFNIGDKVRCKHTNLIGTVVSSPGVPYSNVKWEYVYCIKCDNEVYGVMHLNGHELKKIDK